MKFNLSVIATLLCLTLALSHPACAAGEATIDCSTTPDRCQVLPDLCNSLEATDLGIIGDGTNVSVGSTFSASGGRPPYEVGVSDGVTLDYSDSGVTVSSIPKCVESATLTMIDASEQIETKELQFPIPPLAVSGPDIYTTPAPYTATGGCEPHTFTIDGGLTLTVNDNDNTATIVTDPVCVETATLTVTDFCQHTVEKKIQFPSQPLAIDGPAVAAVSAQYAATGGHPLFTFTVSNGVTLTTSGSTATIATVPACTKTATLTVEDGCHLSATKEIQFPSQPLTISGPTENVVARSQKLLGSTFTASGGTGPYTFSVDKGGIDKINESTGEIISVDCADPNKPLAVVTVTVTDHCGKTASMVGRYASGAWVQVWSKQPAAPVYYMRFSRDDCGNNLIFNHCSGASTIAPLSHIAMCTNAPYKGYTSYSDVIGGIRYFAHSWRMFAGVPDPDLVVDAGKGFHITPVTLSLRNNWWGNDLWISRVFVGTPQETTWGAYNFPCGDIVFNVPIADSIQKEEWRCP